MASTEQHPSAESRHAVHTWTLAEYAAAHPQTPAFPPISDTATKVVSVLLWILIAASVIYIALRAAGVTG